MSLYSVFSHQPHFVLSSVFHLFNHFYFNLLWDFVLTLQGWFYWITLRMPANRSTTLPLLLMISPKYLNRSTLINFLAFDRYILPQYSSPIGVTVAIYPSLYFLFSLLALFIRFGITFIPVTLSTFIIFTVTSWGHSVFTTIFLLYVLHYLVGKSYYSISPFVLLFSCFMILKTYRFFFISSYLFYIFSHEIMEVFLPCFHHLFDYS